MSDGPRNKPPFTPRDDRQGHGREFGGKRRDEGSRTGAGNTRDGGFGNRGERGNAREGGFGERGNTRDGGFGDRGNTRDGGFGDRGNAREGGFRERGAFTGRRDGRVTNSASPQATPRRTVHYQVVMMDEEEWGDTLENRLNTLGRDGWRLVAIDDGRQYVFMQAD